MKRTLALLCLAAAAAGCTLGPCTAGPTPPCRPRTPRRRRPVNRRQPSLVAALSGRSVAVPHRVCPQGEQGHRDRCVAHRRGAARLGITQADQFPTVTASGGAGRGRVSEDINPLGGVDNNFFVAGQVFFEVDLWGRFRRATESARAELMATEEARRVVVFTLVSDVASLYFQLRDLDAKLEISRRTLEGRRESLRLVGLRFEGGVVPSSTSTRRRSRRPPPRPRCRRTSADRPDRAGAVRAARPFPGPNPRGRALDAQALPPEVPPACRRSSSSGGRTCGRPSRPARQTALIGVAEALRYPTSASPAPSVSRPRTSTTSSRATPVSGTSAATSSRRPSTTQNKQRVSSRRREPSRRCFSTRRRCSRPPPKSRAPSSRSARTGANVR